MSLKVRLKIDGVDRQANLPETEWVIENNAHGKLDHATFTIDDPTNVISLSRGVDVIIEAFADPTDRKFGGLLTEVTASTHGLGRRFACKALDWTFLLDRALVNATYRGKSDQFIISDATAGIFAVSETDPSDFTVTTTRVLEGIGNTQFLQFKRSTLRDVLDTLRDMTGNFVWYMASDKILVYEPIGTTGHSFHLSDSPDDSTSFAYMDIKRSISITKLVNQVTVEGSFLRELFADIASADTVYKGDAATVKHLLGYLWQASTGNTRIRVYQNDGADAAPPWSSETEETVGLAGGADTLVSHNTLWDPAARTLEWATAPPNKTNSFRIEGDRLRALIATAKDDASIAALGRIYGHSVKDVTLVSDLHVELRATGELDKLSSEAERMACRTTKDGIQAGLNIGFVNTILGIGSTGNPVDYLVEKVVTRLLGGQVAEYSLQLRAAT